jgi:hypothetical protein
MVKGLKVLTVDGWNGVDTFTDSSETPPSSMIDALNVVVTPNGDAMALRSPANFNTALSTSNKVLSASEYDRAAGSVIIYDINATSGANVASYAVSGGGVNTLLRSTQAAARWQSVNVNDCLYRTNGVETIQYVTSLAAYAIGITAPASAPTVATSIGGGTLVLDVGVTASYGYRNSGTIHVGEASAVSAASGAMTTGGCLKINTTASAQTGVNGIVVFLTEDGGSVRYLVCDAAGDPVVYSNATATITISADYNLLLTVQETTFNAPPPSGVTFMFKWKERIAFCVGRLVYYCGFDQIQIGVPWETVPPLNALAIPAKSEIAQCGIDTQIGALILSGQDAYLAQGSPTDKIDSGVNTLQVTEPLRQLKWGLGTRSPLTLKNCPWGSVWLDQNKHLEFWPWQGTPSPLAVGIWEDLESIQDDDSILAIAEAQWFTLGKNAGFYALTASTSGSTNNRMWFVMIVKRGDQIVVAPSISSIAAQCITTARLSGEVRCFIGVTDRLREILDFDLQGAGWASTDEIYFDFVTGNELTNFNRFHSLRMDGTRPQDMIVRVKNLDESNSDTIQMDEQDGAYFGLVDRYGVRHRVNMEFPTDDLYKREVSSLRLAHGQKMRVI